MLVAGVVNVWAEDSTTSFAPRSVTKTGSLTDEGGNSWTFSSDAQSFTSSTSYIHAGSGSKTVSYIRFTTAAFSGVNIKKIQVWAAAKASSGATTKIKIGNTTLGTSPELGNTASDGGTEFSVTNTNNLSGEITIEVSRSSASKAALYFVKAIVTYESGSSKTAVATIGDLPSTTLNYGAEGTLSPTITPADGLTSSDYTVAWTEVDNDQIFLDENGEYIAGEAGNVDVTVTVTPVASKAEDYEAVSETFSLNIVDNRAEAGLAWSASEVSIELNADEADYKLPTLSNPNNLTLSYASSNDNIAYYDADGWLVDNTSVGTATITVSFAGNSEYKAGSASVTINVYDPNVKGTENNPFTVAEAKVAIDNGVSSSDTYYVKGIISQIDSYDSTHKSITYWISDDGTTTSQFECYSGKGLNGADFSSKDDLQVGTEVIVKGELKKFNSTYEFNYNNEIVWMKTDDRVDVATINGISPQEVNIGTDGTFTLDIDFADGTDATDYEVTLTSSDDNILTVENNGSYLVGNIEGSVTITVAVEPVDNDVYKAVSEAFTITVKDPNKKGTETNPYTVAEVIAMNTAPSENVYVKGWVVGFMKSGPTISTTQSDFTVSNIALADSYDETDVSKVIAVQFSNNSARASLNLKDCPYNLGVAQYLLLGKIGNAFGKKGLQTTLVASKKVAEQLSISTAGMATYYTDCALDFTGLTDMWAYIATLSGDDITFTRVNKVPANTGVLLYNPNKTNASNVVPVATGDMDVVNGNKFVGTLSVIANLTGDNNYILNNGSEGLGFYKVASSGSKVGVHRAYLDASGATSRSFIGLDDDGTTTGIKAVENSQSAFGEFYNLKGQRVTAPQKGLYIVNGKKVMFK